MRKKSKPDLCPGCGKDYSILVKWENGNLTFVHEIGDACHINRIGGKG